MGPNIAAIKDAVPILDVARGYGGFEEVGGGRWLGRCLARDHEDRTPSMSVYADEGRYKCYGCGERGDVIDLVMLVERCERWEALVLLSDRHGVELPGRPGSWHEKQDRQRRVRDAIDREKVEHVRVLLFTLVWKPWLRGLPPSTREEAAQSAWRKSLPMARLIYEQRRGS